MARKPKNTKIDWLPGHLLLLSAFAAPRTREDVARVLTWQPWLHDNLDDALERLLGAGLLEQTSVAERLAYKYKLAELRAMARERGVQQRGVKRDLAWRLAQTDAAGMDQATADVALLRCSDDGEKLVKSATLPNAREMVTRKKLTADALWKVALWLLSAVASGVVGNAVYELGKRLLGVHLQISKVRTIDDVDIVHRLTAQEAEELAKQYSTMIEQNPTDANALFRRALAYGRMGMAGAALFEFASCLKLNVRKEMVLYGCGWVCEENAMYVVALFFYGAVFSCAEELPHDIWSVLDDRSRHLFDIMRQEVFYRIEDRTFELLAFLERWVLWHYPSSGDWRREQEALEEQVHPYVRFWPAGVHCCLRELRWWSDADLRKAAMQARAAAKIILSGGGGTS